MSISENGKKISVCHILPALPAHGAEQLLVDLLRNFDRERFDLSVILISDEGPLAKEVRDLGIPVFLFLRRSRFDLSVLGRIRSHVLKNRIDIVHTHIITADLWGRIALLGTRVLLVTTSHSIHFDSGRVQGALDRALSKITDAVVCVSSRVRDSRRHGSRLPYHRLVVIENGIDFKRLETSVLRSTARELLGLAEEDLALGIIGRLSPVKNHSLLFRSVARVCEGGNWPGFRVLVVGDGELEARLIEEVRALGIEEHVRFLGLRRDIPVILKALDLFVISSTREGLPIVLLEAMKAGLPVIATEVGGIPDVVAHGQSGILIEPDPEILSTAIVRLLSDSQLRERLGDTAAEVVVRKFDVRQGARQYASLYRSIIFRKRLLSLRRSCLRAVGGVVAIPALKTRSRPSLRVLMYHRISDSIEPDILNTPPFMFSRQMEWLKEHGFTPLSATEAINRLFDGSLEPNSVLITFDDGYRDNFTGAYPILRELGWPAMVFPTSDFVLGVSSHPRYAKWNERIEYLTPSQIKEMSANGIEFGSHGKTHVHFPKMTLDEAESELKESREWLERWTGKPVTLFAYPNGLYAPDHVRLLEKMGFAGAFTTHAGTNTRKSLRFELCRTEISGRDSLGDFSLKLQGKLDDLYSKYQKIKKLYDVFP